MNADNPEFWKKMFWSKACGSGSQRTLHGWLLKFYNCKAEHDLTLIGNFNPTIATVEYTDLSDPDKAEYETTWGLFSSQERGGFLVPEFNYMVHKKA